MKNFNWSAVVGCLIISIGIIIAGQGIMSSIDVKSFGGSVVPGSFDIYNHDSGDFLNENEAANYLKIEYETLEKWIQSGKLKGAYTKIDVTKSDEDNSYTAQEYIFSRAKLNEFMNNLINSES